jgi:hypothetical protein
MPALAKIEMAATFDLMVWAGLLWVALMGGGLAAHELTSSADLSRNRKSLAGANLPSAICCELFRVEMAVVPPHTTLSYPRRRVPSTPRLIDSITEASGILDRRRSRTMTTEYISAFSRREAPELCWKFSLTLEARGRRECRVRAAPAVSCAKG